MPPEVRGGRGAWAKGLKKGGAKKRKYDDGQACFGIRTGIV